MPPQSKAGSYLGSLPTFSGAKRGTDQNIGGSTQKKAHHHSSNSTYSVRKAPSTHMASASNNFALPSTQQTKGGGSIHPIASDSKRPTTSHSVRTGTGNVLRQHPAPPKRIMAIAEGRGVAIEIGLCIFDVNSCEAVISQLADSQTFTRTLQKVHLNDPQKILVTSSSMDYNKNPTNHGGPSKLCQSIRQQFPHISIITLPRKYFNDETGRSYINDYGLQEDTAGLLVGVTTKYFCLAAISGTFRHIFENEAYSFAEHTIKFVYQGAEGTMLIGTYNVLYDLLYYTELIIDTTIDTVTAKNLELVLNTTNSHTRNTLLGILDRTLTPMGKRLLRMNILQPPCCIDVIKDRLDAIEELSNSEESIFNIQSCLKQLSDLDYTIAYLVKVPNNISTKKSITAVQHAEMKVNQIITLKQAVKCIQDIATRLPQKIQNHSSDNNEIQNEEEEEKQILLRTIYKILSSSAFTEFEKAIDEYINEEVGIQKTSLGIRNQKCYAVKAGVNGLLDVARQTYRETTEDIYELVSNYTQRFGMQMKLQFSASVGFYITMATSQLDKNDGELPDEFINVITKKKNVQFTTLELLQKNNRINESLTEVYLMSDRIVSELLQTFRDNINILYKSSEAIALLDMLTSLAACNISSDYVRPEFSDTIAIKAGRHPILDHILSFPLVPNDSFASLSSSFQFITGPNMSGKSTYLRQIALLTIMAQMGSFIPAEYASFRLSDQLLSRLANDNMFSDIGTSSFMSEMRETAYLLQHITSTSIVIIDELGRGTSPSDALSITAAVCEDIIKTRAFCFFATHLHELTKTLDVYPNVVNLQFKVNVTKHSNNNCTVDYQYKIEDGHLSCDNHYGLHTAQVLGFPKEILSCAYKIVEQLKANKAKTEAQKKLERELSKERKLLWFADKVLQLGQIKMSPEQLHEQVEKLQIDMWNEEN